MSDIRPQPDWFQDDSFWEVMAPFMFHSRRLAAAPIEVDGLIHLLGLEPPAAVLDLACGPGRHSLELARRGFRVTGVDRTPRYLEQSRAAAQQANLEIEFIQSDMRDFVRPGAFDAAINMFTAFGYFQAAADDRRVVQNAFESLKPGGSLLVEMMGKEILARIYRERDWVQEGDLILLEERSLRDNWSLNDVHWIALAGDKRHDFRFTTRLYSAVELAALYKDCGFAESRFFGDLAGAPYDHAAKRLIGIGRKG